MALILIADDSMFQRFTLANIAKELGHETVEARDGDDCLEKIRTSRPDMVMLDLNMPGKGGIEVLQAISDEGLDVNVLVITADIQSTTRKRCEDLSAAGFLNKPAEEEQIKAKLSELLG